MTNGTKTYGTLEVPAHRTGQRLAAARRGIITFRFDKCGSGKTGRYGGDPQTETVKVDDLSQAAHAYTFLAISRRSTRAGGSSSGTARVLQCPLVLSSDPSSGWARAEVGDEPEQILELVSKQRSGSDCYGGPAEDPEIVKYDHAHAHAHRWCLVTPTSLLLVA